MNIIKHLVHAHVHIKDNKKLPTYFATHKDIKEKHTISICFQNHLIKEMTWYHPRRRPWSQNSSFYFPLDAYLRIYHFNEKFTTLSLLFIFYNELMNTSSWLQCSFQCPLSIKINLLCPHSLKGPFPFLILYLTSL